MKPYEVTITTKDGRRVRDRIEATSYFDARRIMEARYPGCSIWNIREVR